MRRSAQGGNQRLLPIAIERSRSADASVCIAAGGLLRADAASAIMLAIVCAGAAMQVGFLGGAILRVTMRMPSPAREPAPAPEAVR